MDLEARQVIENRIIDLKVKRMNIRREIFEVDQEISEKNEEIEALLNGTNGIEVSGVSGVSADSSETLKRKWSVEDEGFGSASDCEASAAKRWPGANPASGTGPSTDSVETGHKSSPAPAIDVDSLLANLLSAGVIHKPSQGPTEALRAQAKPVIPNLRNPKSLRPRNSVAVAALYSGVMNGGNGRALANPDSAKSPEAKSTAQYPTVADWTRC